ncbi:MAG: hypothetical protein ACKOFP_00900 [Actinomycetota bacterium]
MPEADLESIFDSYAVPVRRYLYRRLTTAADPAATANDLFVKEHYLHRGRTMAQIAYWITLDDERMGLLQG